MTILGRAPRESDFDRVVTQDETLSAGGRVVFRFLKGVVDVAARDDARAAWSDIDEVAQRYADLALTMLRARDGRAYAA